MQKIFTVSVFSFRVYDRQARCMTVAQYKATPDGIAELDDEVVDGTEEHVPSDEVDLLGCYSRSVSTWAELE